MKSWRNVFLLFSVWGLTAGLAFWKGGFAGSFLFYSVGVVFVYILLVQLFSLVKVEMHREITNSRLVAGDEVHIHVRLRQYSWMPLAWLAVREEWSCRGKSALGTTAKVQHQALFFPWWKQTFEYQYTIRGLHRGIYTLSRSMVTGGDIFGCVAKRVNADVGGMQLIVFPKPLAVSQGRTQSAGSGEEVMSGRHTWQNSMQVGGIRDYVYGDPMSHIHWKATARARTLKTKEMELSATNKIMIFLDAQDSSYQMNAGNELFECVVQLAAGLIQYSRLGKMQWGITMTDKANHILPISRKRESEQGYELLAEVQPDGEGVFHQILKLSVFRLPPDTSLLIITPSLEEPLADAISELRRRKLGVGLIYVQEAPVLGWKARQMRGRLEAMGCSFSWINANHLKVKGKDGGVNGGEVKSNAGMTEGGMAYAGSS